MKINGLYRWLIGGIGFALLLTGCGKQDAGMPEDESGNFPQIALTSPAFESEATIPVQYTCDGEDISPPLVWSEIPEGTQSFALIADDPDAPGGTWVHWVLFNIPADVEGLPEGGAEGGDAVGVPGRNDFRSLGYGGPCPPPGNPHRYFFKLYALDTTLALAESARVDDLQEAMQGHVLAAGQLVGTYQR